MKFDDKSGEQADSFMQRLLSMEPEFVGSYPITLSIYNHSACSAAAGIKQKYVDPTYSNLELHYVKL